MIFDHRGMTKKDLTTRAEEIGNAIRDILFDEWDPIGVNDIAPRDEYDTYAGKIYGYLRDGRDAHFLAKHLRHLESSAMDSLTNDEHRMMIANRLLAIDVSLPHDDSDEVS